MNPHASIEVLETRIVPAAVFTFTDLDGDIAKITTSLGTNADLAAAATVVGGQLQMLDLTAAVFRGTDVKASVVKKSATGDGLVNLGHIKAGGRDLGSVAIAGDLGDIDCGDATTSTTALNNLRVRSLGRFGLATQGGVGDLSSEISGPMGALKVQRDIAGATVYVDAGDDGDLGSAFVGGSIIGGATANSGQIQTTGDLGPVTIGGDLVGGLHFFTGTLYGGAKIASVSIGGSVIGGASAGSGAIFSSGELGPVKIRGDFAGGLGSSSGKIVAAGKVASVSIDGSLLAGAGEGSGSVIADAALGPVSIGGNLVGAGADTGVIHGAAVASVRVGGSVLGGAGAGSGSIIADGDLGPVKIGRDVRGGAGDESGKIDASGKLTSVTIGGMVLGGGGKYDTRKVGTVTHYGQVFSGDTLGVLNISGNVQGGDGSYSAGVVSAGAIEDVKIGGSVLGGGGAVSASIVTSASDIGRVWIGHDLRGGDGSGSARIVSSGRLGAVTIGGSLIGGAGFGSGSLDTIGTETAVVKIAHDVAGGSGGNSGLIGGAIAVRIGGSLIGGSGNGSGGIHTAETDLLSVRIGHDLLGGSIPALGSTLDYSGYIVSDQRLGRVFVGGSIVSGTDGTAGAEELAHNATIRAAQDIGSFTVRGGLIGNVTPAGDSPVIISARGQAAPGPGTDMAIGKISIGGRVERAQVFAGYDVNLVPKNADAQIGSVTVGADWIASSIVVGAVNLGADNAPGGTGANTDNINFGNLRDHKITGGTDRAGAISQIGRLTIAGQVFGTPESSNSMDRFGFIAEKIGALKVGVRTYALSPDSGDDGFPVNWRLDPTAYDTTLHELGQNNIGFSISTPGSAKLANASTVTYLDKDGDKVTVKLSKPLLTAGNVNNVFHFDTGMVDDGVAELQQLRYLDLGALATNGLGVTLSVARSSTGDGLVNVGAIVSTDFDMGRIVVPGDLGQIAGGASTPNKPGLASLNVRTLGRLGLDTQGPVFGTFSPKLGGEINGGIGTFNVKQDVVGANMDVAGAIGSVTIGGSLIGGDKLNSGLIAASTTIGAVKIGHHLQGGFGLGSGVIKSSNAGIASLAIGGSVLGGSGIQSGSTFGGVTGLVQVGHNVRGGTSQNAGTIGIESGGAVTVGGSIIGGHGDFGGRIIADGALGAVEIAHNVLGGFAESAARIQGNSIASVTIGGSLLGGSGANSGSITGGGLGPVKIAHDVAGGSGNLSGRIGAGAGLAGVRIGGSLLGGSGFGSGNLGSVGKMGPVKILGAVVGSAGELSGSIESATGLEALSVGGSIVGGSGRQSGLLEIAGDIGAVSIGHDLVGGSDAFTGQLGISGTLASLRIGGSIFGGSGSFSGQVQASGNVGAVGIGGDIRGGSATFSGELQLNGKTAGVTIGGSLIGGSANDTGAVLAADLGSVKIGRNLIGASVIGAESVASTGFVLVDSIARVSVGGSLFAGFDASTGSLLKNASIRAEHDIGTLSVRGSLHGTATPDGITPVVISALGQKNPTATTNVAIKSINIGGSVERANIFCGYQTDLTAGAALVQVGAVTVGRDWIASNLVVGAQNLGADDAPGGTGANADNVNLGAGHDTAIGAGDSHTRIASIVIGGIVAGTAAGGDHFGFVSQQIGSFKSRNFTAPLTADPEGIQLSLTTGDVTIHEVEL